MRTTPVDHPEVEAAVQVRAIEFQENFRQVPVEASRQQNVLLRDAATGRQMAAAVAAEEQAHNLGRPRAFEAPSESRPVDADVERARLRRPRKGPHQEDQQRSGRRNRSNADEGGHIDFVA